jgi:hypothetical protein
MEQESVQDAVYHLMHPDEAIKERKRKAVFNTVASSVLLDRVTENLLDGNEKQSSTMEMLGEVLKRDSGNKRAAWLKEFLEAGNGTGNVEDLFQRMRQQKDLDPELCFLNAALVMSEGLCDEGEVLLEEIANVHTDALAWLATRLSLTGRCAASMKLYKRVLEEDCTNPLALWNLHELDPANRLSYLLRGLEVGDFQCARDLVEHRILMDVPLSQQIETLTRTGLLEFVFYNNSDYSISRLLSSYKEFFPRIKTQIGRLLVAWAEIGAIESYKYLDGEDRRFIIPDLLLY